MLRLCDQLVIRGEEREELGRMTPGFWLQNRMDGAAILRQRTQGRERFREKIRFREVSFGLLGVKVLMGDQTVDIH